MIEEALFDPKQINLPFTIAIIKPDTLLEPAKTQQIISLIEKSGSLSIRNMIQRQLYREEAMNLFYRHQSKPYFQDLVSYLISGECCVMLLINAPQSQGNPIEKWKKLIGPSNPDQAKKSQPNSLRAKYGKNLIRNELHGSDNLAQANKERKIFNMKVPQQPPAFTHDPYKVALDSMQQFLQPPNLQHSCINERMDIFATYGPIVNWHGIEQCFCAKCRPTAREKCNALRSASKSKLIKTLKQKQISEIYNELCERCKAHTDHYSHLMGGRDMQHVLTDNQIAGLAQESNRKDLLQLLRIEKGSTAQAMVQQMDVKQPSILQYKYEHFAQLIKPLHSDYYGRYDFTELQHLILEDRRVRISYWVAQITNKPIERFPAVTTLDNTLTAAQLQSPKSPFFTLTRTLPLTLLVKAEMIHHVPLTYPASIVNKAKLHPMEENLKIEKLLHRNMTKVVVVGEHTSGAREAVSLLREYQEGRHADWNNYSTLKGSQTKAPVGGKQQQIYIDK